MGEGWGGGEKPQLIELLHKKLSFIQFAGIAILNKCLMITT